MADAIDLSLFADSVPRRSAATGKGTSTRKSKTKPALCPCPP
jgi:hypothetical protein